MNGIVPKPVSGVCAWRCIADTFHGRSCSMAKRTIDQFFAPTPKRVQTTAPQPAAALVCAATSAAAEDGKENLSAPTQDVKPAPLVTDTASGDITEVQQRRIQANRSMALAKQAVSKAQRDGKPPLLADLLTEPSWAEAMLPHMRSPSFQALQTFLEQEWRSGATVFPTQDNLFRALNTCPFSAVRVVVLGQDPYHNDGQAMGLSFSVPKGVAVPSSLQNIYKELNTDLNLPRPRHGDLQQWCAQGVLLLNACLTVRAHQAASHSKKGWEQFTDAAIQALSRERSGLVFLLWGKFAQSKAGLIDKSKHHVLMSAHPSGLSAARGFFGCKHFSQTNALLTKQGLQPIDWQITD